MVADNQQHSTLAKKPRSHAIAGWLASGIRLSGSIEGPETVTAGLNTCLDVHHATGTSHMCASTLVPHMDTDSGLVGIVIGSPQWTEAVLQTIAEQQGDSAALIAAYQAYGQGLTDHLRGPFAFALLDPISSTALLGIDRMGRYPMYYCSTDNGLLFGTSATSVLAMQPQAAPVCPQGLYDYIYFHMVPGPAPVFEGLAKLQAGCIVRYEGGAYKTRRYWLPQFRESTPNSRPEMYDALRGRLRQAVSTSLPATGKVGAFLSGGLDSSTVTGMLAEISTGPCDVYSIGFAAKGYDEMDYARITAEHFGARLHEYYVTPDDVVDALPLIASSYDEPFGNSSALPAYFCAKMAASDGVDLLLAGDGGDEIFAGNERYAKQKTFENYKHLPTFLAKGLVEPIVRAAPAWIPLAEKARSYILQANTPLPGRLQNYNFLHRHQADEVFLKAFLKEVKTDYPLAIQRELYNTPEPASTLNRMLFLDWQFTLADNDLRKVSQTCAMAGVEVAYPMLDDELVEFSIGIPSDWKLPGGKLRDFYKKALTGWLPEATLTKSKQGFGLPFGVWMREHRPLQDIAYDNILKLKSRGIFNPTFLDKAIEAHRKGHAAYFGELVWILTVLELWLEAHRSNG